MQIIVFSKRNPSLNCMAVGFLQSFAPKAKVTAVVAEQTNLHQLTDELMKEACIDISSNIVMLYLKEIDWASFDLLVTLNTQMHNFTFLEHIPKQIHLEFDDSAFDQNEFEKLRFLRDQVKNEMYIVYRDWIRK